jgi:hypothetical protein
MARVAKLGCPANIRRLQEMLVLPGAWGRTNSGDPFHVETNVSILKYVVTKKRSVTRAISKFIFLRNVSSH